MFGEVKLNNLVNDAKYALALMTIAGAAATLPTEAVAQSKATGGGDVKILNLKVYERAVRGRLNLCGVEYFAVFEDNVYLSGAVSGLRGSVALMGFVDSDKIPAVLLKATAFNWVNKKFVFAPLDYAYLKVAGSSFAGVENAKFTCDDGGVCIGYNILAHPNAAFFGSEFKVAITRADGGTDVEIPISFTGKNAEESIKLSSCIIRLIKEIKNKIQ